MKKIQNNKKVDFQILKESGIYSEVLLEEIRNGNYHKIPELVDKYNIKNVDYMEPLLYAVKNEYGTYKVYRYYGENLQEDIEVARDIIIEEPELIEGTPLSNVESFILESAKINPEVVLYMSQNLKEDIDFAEDLCELNYKEVTKYVAKECKMPDTIIENPNLAENKVFMLEAVKQDIETLKYAPEEFKNNYDFMKEISNDKENINYIVEHIDDFGTEGLSGTKDALVEISSDEAVSGFKEEQQKIKEQIEEKVENSENNKELEDLLIRDKQLERHIKFFERIKNGEVDPVRAAKLIDKLCKNLDDKYKEEIKQILKLDEAILEKQKEIKEKKIQEQEEFKIMPQNIENITEEASLEKVKTETNVIKKEITNERNPKKMKMGENINDKSDDERA